MVRTAGTLHLRTHLNISGLIAPGLSPPTVRGDLLDIENQVARGHTDDPRCGVELVHWGPSRGDRGGA
jgi:hypothetical protein